MLLVYPSGSDENQIVCKGRVTLLPTSDNPGVIQRVTEHPLDPMKRVGLVSINGQLCIAELVTKPKPIMLDEQVFFMRDGSWGTLDIPACKGAEGTD